MFSTESLYFFLRRQLGPTVVDCLPAPRGMALTIYAAHVAAELFKKGLVTAAFFAGWREALPGRAQDVSALEARISVGAHAWPASGELGNPPQSVRARREAGASRTAAPDTCRHEFLDACLDVVPKASRGTGVEPDIMQVKPRRLIYERVPVQGFLAFDDLENPYEHLRDATDRHHDSPTIHAYAWFPHAQYIMSRNLQTYTPSAVVSAVDPEAVVSRLVADFGWEITEMFRIPPRKLRNEEKERLLRAMGTVMDDCFEVAVTFPRLILEVGYSTPKVAYEVMINGFILPFVQLHLRHGFDRFTMEAMGVGSMDGHLVKLLKRVLKVCYPRRRQDVFVCLHEGDPVSRTMLCMARLFAWTVATLHNSGNARWVELLESAVENDPKRSAVVESTGLEGTGFEGISNEDARNDQKGSSHLEEPSMP